jgi:2-keto-4-pentenoate hydratase/2-oxohepta-3-ene-1,7-dioic acid hydratase in catechol pathway
LVLGHGVPLIRPKASVKFDYEGELGVIIAKKAVISLLIVQP